MTEPKISKEMAEQEFDRFLEAMDIEADPVDMDEDDKKGFEQQKSKLVSTIMSGSVIIDDDGQPVFTPKRSGGEPITEPGATEAGDTLPDSAATTACYTDGAWTDVPVYERDALPSGVRIEGPAIVVESNGTVVVEPGWSGELTAIR